MKKILIIFGGNSFEHEISCKSVNFILENIDKSLFNYSLVGIDFNNQWFEIKHPHKIDINWKNNIINKINNIVEYLKSFDNVLPIVHGNTGEDGKLQSLFEIFNIKYVGCNSQSSFICYDKLLTKLFLKEYSIPQVSFKIYSESINYKTLKYPLIVKPCKCGSSLGIKMVCNKRELIKAIKIAKKFDNNVLIEKYIKNKRELECAIIEKENNLVVSDIGEIFNNSKIYDFKSKYIKKATSDISSIETNIKLEVKKYSRAIFKILNCKHLSRLDFIYDIDNKKLYFNEINTLPGLTDISMYPFLLNKVGISNKELVSTLLSM